MAKITPYMAMFAVIFLLSSGVGKAGKELPPPKPQCVGPEDCNFVCNGMGICHTADGTCVCGPTGDPNKPFGPVRCIANSKCTDFCSPQGGSCDLEAQVCRCNPLPPPDDSDYDSAHH